MLGAPSGRLGAMLLAYAQEALQGMTALSSGAVGTARDVLSLAAVQHVVGASSGIQAGALMQGVMGATGAQASSRRLCSA